MEKLLRIDDVLKIIPVCKSTWYNWIQKEEAPPPVRLGKSRGSFWKEADIIAFVNQTESQHTTASSLYAQPNIPRDCMRHGQSSPARAQVGAQ